MKQKHIESMNISRYKCAYCVNGNPHFYTILLERKRDYFLRNNVPNFLNSILLYLLFPKHWRNIHIYSIRSTHKTYMVAPSLKLNTTIVTRVIDEHLEFPIFISIFYVCSIEDFLVLTFILIMALCNVFFA